MKTLSILVLVVTIAFSAWRVEAAAAPIPVSLPPSVQQVVVPPGQITPSIVVTPATGSLSNPRATNLDPNNVMVWNGKTTAPGATFTGATPRIATTTWTAVKLSGDWKKGGGGGGGGGGGSSTEYQLFTHQSYVTVGSMVNLGAGPVMGNMIRTSGGDGQPQGKLDGSFASGDFAVVGATYPFIKMPTAANESWSEDSNVVFLGGNAIGAVVTANVKYKAPNVAPAVSDSLTKTF